MTSDHSIPFHSIPYIISQFNDIPDADSDVSLLIAESMATGQFASIVDFDDIECYVIDRIYSRYINDIAQWLSTTIFRSIGIIKNRHITADKNILIKVQISSKHIEITVFRNLIR